MSKDNKYKQFLIKDGMFVPTTNIGTLSAISPGAYTLSQNMSGDIIFCPKELTNDNFIDMPSMVTSQIVDEIKTFWQGETREKFDRFGIVYKRGILMHGAPGTGKTSAIFKIIDTAVSLGGIAIYNPSPALFSHATQALRDIQGECKVVCVFEEFDNYHHKADFLSLLDGELQVPNVVYLATTNYIDRIPDNLKKRPGRFAKVVEVTKPDIAARRVYFTAKLPHLDAKEIETWAKRTDDMVIDQLKDVIINVQCFGVDFASAVKTVKALGSKSFGLAQDSEEEN